VDASTLGPRVRGTGCFRDTVCRVVPGFHGGSSLSEAIANYKLGGKLDDVRALVAFIKSQN